MPLSHAVRKHPRVMLFAVLVTALVIWAVTKKGLAALPELGQRRCDRKHAGSPRPPPTQQARRTAA